MAALEVQHLSKTFGTQTVLDDASLAANGGEILALIGQNGSGKSTLIKLLAGYHTPDPGASATVFGQSLEIGSARDAHDKRLRFVHQDLGLVNDLSVVENLMMGRAYPRAFPGRIDWRTARRRTSELVARVGLDIDVRRPVGDFGFADKTGVAIARALPEGEDEQIVLVLDEPTAALPAQDVERLFVTMRQLRDAGHALVIVSHHLDEILEIADWATVLRDGRVIATEPTGQSDAQQLTRLIVGADLDTSGTRGENQATGGQVALSLQGLSGSTVSDVSIDVRGGEIVGIAGLSGSGREIIGALVTGRMGHEGTIAVDGKVVPAGDPAAALEAGMASVPGERARYGVFKGMTVRQNMTMGSLSRHRRRGYIMARAERAEVKGWITEFGIVARGPDVLIESLSGGNQQKVLVARAMRQNPKVLVLDDPTAGIDVGARDQVHRIFERHVREDMAILLISTDSDELARLCDRVVVLRKGIVAEVLERGVDMTADHIDGCQVAGAAA